MQEAAAEANVIFPSYEANTHVSRRGEPIACAVVDS